MENDHQKPMKQSSLSSSISPKNDNHIEVVIVPFPAQSHLNLLFKLSHIISSYNDNNKKKISVHFVGSALHNSQLKSHPIQALNPNSSPIQFHDFPNPPPFTLKYPDRPENPNFPAHLDAYLASYVAYLHPHVTGLVTALSATARRVVVVHDSLTGSSVQDSSALPNAEIYAFHYVSAVSCLSILLSTTGVKTDGPIPSPEGCFSPEFAAFLAHQCSFLETNQVAGQLYNTSRVIESDFLDLLLEKEKELIDESMKSWAVGPFERVTPSKSKPSGAKCLEWLEKQESNSVLYVCFGTITVLEDEQIRELTLGLERSKTKFIWVLTDAEKFGARVSSQAQLPLGFEERAEKEGLGMIVREWVPQLEILGHSSTGGFLSHCGWNSCLESLSLGVPLAAWPMHSDQPTNAALITGLLKAGLVVREWAKRDELVSSLVIAEAVKRLMRSEEGDEMRKRAEFLGSELRKSTEKGGVSQLELDSFVAHITRAS